MMPLFAYGTLRRTAWRRALLGADYTAQPATLHGWERVALPRGYLSLRQAPQARTEGVLLVLDALGWRIADAWEEVPVYRRVAVTVATETQPRVRAQVYVCPAPFAPRADAQRDALLDDDAVDAAIAAFAPTMLALRAAQTVPMRRPSP
jgi:gamma-glutamylcyclotransferase (GGCT)/AIG2-like uncharacterized protein YtfP